MKDFSTFQIDELKLVYRILHRSLMENMELMDTDFLQGLQSWLQFRAGRDGIDIADHAQWDAWLGGEIVSCEERVAQRRILQLVPDSDHSTE